MKPHPNRTRRTVVANVNAEMGRRRVTQKQMAQWLGISQAAASERLTNKTPFTLDELDVLADRLQVPIAALITEVNYAAQAAGFPAAFLGGLVPGQRPITGEYVTVSRITAGTVNEWSVTADAAATAWLRANVPLHRRILGSHTRSG